MTVRVPKQSVGVVSGVGIAARTSDTPGLLLGGRGREAGCRGADFVGIRQSRIIAVQTAIRVVCVEEPSLSEPAAEGYLHSVIPTLRCGHREVRRKVRIRGRVGHRRAL